MTNEKIMLEVSAEELEIIRKAMCEYGVNMMIKSTNVDDVHDVSAIIKKIDDAKK